MKKGFTLIELLVVVVIIGILSAIALPQYQKSILKSRFVQAKLLASSLARAQQAVFTDSDDYATNLSDLPIDIPLSRSGEKCMGSSCNFSWGRVWLDGGKTYVASTLWEGGSPDRVGYIVPLDGSKPYCYVYDESAGKKKYHQLCAAETGRSLNLSGHTYTYP